MTNNTQLSRSTLFTGISSEEMAAMLPCLRASEVSFARGERIMREGQRTGCLGVVLEGTVRVEVGDAWGDVAILESLGPGELFAQSYACSGEPLGLDVVADSACTVALLHVDRIMRPCPKSCACHWTISANLMRHLARRNLAMDERAAAMSPRTIRGKVLAYLSKQQARAGASTFTIPFSQTKLANYLCVDRSALSAELSKLRREGVIDYEGSTYTLL